MTVNLMEMAYHCEQMFRKTEEFTNFKRKYSEVIGDPATLQLFNQFLHLQNTLLHKEMNGQQIRQEEIEALDKYAKAATQNQKIAQLMEAEHRVNNMMMELNKIIMKPMEDIYSQDRGSTLGKG